VRHNNYELCDVTLLEADMNYEMEWNWYRIGDWWSVYRTKYY